MPAGEMYGEGNWKADEEYRQGLKEFSKTYDAESLARGAAEEVDEEDVIKGKKKGEGQEENEW